MTLCMLINLVVRMAQNSIIEMHSSANNSNKLDVTTVRLWDTKQTVYPIFKDPALQ